MVECVHHCPLAMMYNDQIPLFHYYHNVLIGGCCDFYWMTMGLGSNGRRVFFSMNKFIITDILSKDVLLSIIRKKRHSNWRRIPAKYFDPVSQ